MTSPGCSLIGSAPLESSTRLVLLDALAAAAGEITLDLAPGSVEVRLRGRDPEFVVTSPPGVHLVDDDVIDVARRQRCEPRRARRDEANTSRITLRLPEHLRPTPRERLRPRARR